MQSAHEALEQLSQDQQQRLQQLERLQQQSQQQHQSQRTARGSSTERVSNQPPVHSEAHQNNGRVSWHEQSQSRHHRDHSDTSQHHTREHQRDQSLRVDGQQFEESVGGGLATSTPVHYALHPPGTAQQALHEKNAALSLYEVRFEF